MTATTIWQRQPADDFTVARQTPVLSTAGSRLKARLSTTTTTTTLSHAFKVRNLNFYKQPTASERTEQLNRYTLHGTR